METEKVVTANIAKEIKHSPKSQTQIAAEMGVSKQVISDYMAGRSFPSIFTLIKLCYVLDCEYRDILGEPR